MKNHDLEIIYEQLKDKYDLVLTNTFSLENGFEDYREDFQILCGESSIGQFQFYHNGLQFILDIDRADGSYTHFHPLDVSAAVDSISAFMDGTADWL